MSNMSDEIRQMMERIEAKRAAMPAEERRELERLELEAQRASWVKAMGPCEHGVLDFEDCAECRKVQP